MFQTKIKLLLLVTKSSFYSPSGSWSVPHTHFPYELHITTWLKEEKSTRSIRSRNPLAWFPHGQLCGMGLINPNWHAEPSNLLLYSGSLSLSTSKNHINCIWTCKYLHYSTKSDRKYVTQINLWTGQPNPLTNWVGLDWAYVCLGSAWVGRPSWQLL